MTQGRRSGPASQSKAPSNRANSRKNMQAEHRNRLRKRANNFDVTTGAG
jgi:hypothetical protein